MRRFVAAPALAAVAVAVALIAAGVLLVAWQDAASDNAAGVLAGLALLGLAAVLTRRRTGRLIVVAILAAAGLLVLSTSCFWVAIAGEEVARTETASTSATRGDQIHLTTTRTRSDLRTSYIITLNGSDDSISRSWFVWRGSADEAPKARLLDGETVQVTADSADFFIRLASGDWRPLDPVCLRCPPLVRP